MFHWLEIRTFCHATEDEERVVAALRAVLPDGEVKRDALEGHFGNPLVAIAVRTERATDIKEVWRRIVASLGRDDLLRDLGERLDEDLVYHLRLDKQRAYLGVIARLSSGDVLDLRAKVAAFPKKRDTAERALRAFLEDL